MNSQTGVISTGVHDIGGMKINDDMIDTREQPCLHWEKQTHALLVCLAQKGLTTTDEHRRSVEALPGYDQMAYYHRWACALINICVERGTFSKADLDSELGQVLESKSSSSFNVGDMIEIRREDSKIRWRKPHLRTPGYVFGCRGEIIRYLGSFPDPEAKAFSKDNITQQPLYLVQLRIADLWEDYPVFGQSGSDTVTVEVYEPWLNDAHLAQQKREQNVQRNFVDSKPQDHGDHVHDNRSDTEVEALRREIDSNEISYGQTLSNAIKNILVRKGFLCLREIQNCIESMDSKGEMKLGQKIVARAWTDQGFKARLLVDAHDALKELGIEASNPNAPTKLVVVENTPEEHHVIVCTLCSCYPSAILGISPAWYRSRSYRARTVREPRKVLAEFGLTIGSNSRIVVHDSTADCRYLVVPMRPTGTDGMSEAQLQNIVTRDCMIGVAVPTA